MSWFQKNKAGLDFGTSLLGLGLGLRESHKDRSLARNQFAAQMDESVQRRVADARKAGVHPLFALGASVGASPTTTVGGGAGAIADLTRNIGEALARAQIRATEADAKKSEAEASLADSKAATVAHHLAARGRDGVATVVYPSGGKAAHYTDTPNDFSDGPVFGPAEFYNPEVPVSQAVGIAAGDRPGIVRITMPDGRTVENYDPELGLDEIGQLNYIIQRSRHYVADALTAARPYVSDGAILGYLKRLLPKGKPTANPPGSGHRTRRRKPVRRKERRK